MRKIKLSREFISDLQQLPPGAVLYEFDQEFAYGVIVGEDEELRLSVEKGKIYPQEAVTTQCGAILNNIN